MIVNNTLDQVKDGSDWSSLPTLLLWMINDRLDRYNGIRLALVCKNWEHASLSYPVQNEFDADNSPPWIMTYRGKITDNRVDFTSLLTEERYKFNSPEFSCSAVLYSKQGWLLLLKKKLNKDGSLSDLVDTSYDSPYLLFNPFKNKKISLPFIKETLHGAFTIKDGDPHCVVLATSENAWIRYRPTIALYISYPGYDNVWLRYSYPCKKGEYSGSYLDLDWVFMIGKLVYFITEETRVFIFDVTTLQWNDLMEESTDQLQGKQYIIERQKELFRFSFPKGVMDIRKADCYKLNIVDNVFWESVDTNFLAPKCHWYLSNLFGHSFAFDASDDLELVKVGKIVGKTLEFTVFDKSKWVHMG